jgi:alpha-L-fucosidase 2
LICGPQTYNGGNDFPNQTVQLSQWMQTYREEIMQAPTGTIQGRSPPLCTRKRCSRHVRPTDISQLQTNAGSYGSYAGAGYILATLNVSSAAAYTDYARWLDMDAGIASSTFAIGNTTYLKETFCAHPSRACVQHLGTASGDASLPGLTVAWSNYTENDMPLLPNVTCADDSTLRIRGLVSVPGMLYEMLLRVQTGGGGAQVNCSAVPVVSTAAIQGPSLFLFPRTW